MDIVERLVAFKESTGLTNSQFADGAGIPRPTLSQFINGRNKRISDDFTAKLHAAYPELNVMWLLFGEGDMVIKENIETSEGKNNEKPSLFDAESIENEINTSLNDVEKSSQKNEANYEIERETQEFSRRERPMPFDERSAHHFASATPQAPHPIIQTDPAKKVQSIIVYYSDNSFETFIPANSVKK